MKESLTLAQRLLLSRRDLNWNQEEVADKSNVSRTYISDIERGRISNVGLEVIGALAQALGVSPGYLAGWEENPLAGISEDKEEEETLQLTEEEEVLLAAVRQLDSQKIKLLMGIVKLLQEG